VLINLSDHFVFQPAAGVLVKRQCWWCAMKCLIVSATGSTICWGYWRQRA